jgi:DNA-binding XRE family transcriptional regulator
MHTIAHEMVIPFLSVMMPPLLMLSTHLRQTFRKKTDAEFVRSAREKLGLTQAELADKLGIERRTIMRYESKTPLPLTTRFALMYLLRGRRKKKRRG